MRQARPYFKKSHRAWYANIDPRKNPVWPASREGGEAKPYEKYHQLMAGRQPVGIDCLAVDLLERFLDTKQALYPG
jgi:hypothetical protein